MRTCVTETSTWQFTRCHSWLVQQCLTRLCGGLLLAAGCGLLVPALLSADDTDWSTQQIAKLPASEQAVKLFNGKDLTGWSGQKDKLFFVEDGIIVARNDEKNAPAASTYLVTDKNYRNFRLIFEAKLVKSEMHSGISLWGQTVEKAGDKFSYQGHLVMFPSDYGYYDLYRRNSIFKDPGVAKKAGKQHDWNRMEILATDNRIRQVVNGQLVADWSDPKPELCVAGPIGLQLHSNKVPQEVQFRGLILTENPADQLVTVDAAAAPGEQNKTAKQAANPNPQAGSLDTEALAKIPARLQEFVEAGTISGAVTLVAKGNQVHIASTGKADLANNRAMEADSLFAIASMTKPITATALLMLHDSGKVSLIDPVSKYIPEFKDIKLADGKAPQREITIKDLLTHTSGLAGDQKNIGTLAETAVAIAKRPLAFEPGSKWQYSPGISVCGRIVEVVSGQPFEDFLQERIFTPLQMTETTFNPTPDQQKRIAQLYQPAPDGKSLVPTQHWLSDVSVKRTPNPSGGLFSTAADLAKFYQMILAGGEANGQRIVSPHAIKQMSTIQTGELVTGFTPGNGWGLGWCVIKEPQGVSVALSPGSFGHGGAFGTQAWLDPQRNLVCVLLIQRANMGNSDASEMRAVFQKMAVEALRP